MQLLYLNICLRFKVRNEMSMLMLSLDSMWTKSICTLEYVRLKIPRCVVLLWMVRMFKKKAGCCVRECVSVYTQKICVHRQLYLFYTDLCYVHA